MISGTNIPSYCGLHLDLKMLIKRSSFRYIFALGAKFNIDFKPDVEEEVNTSDIVN